MSERVLFFMWPSQCNTKTFQKSLILRHIYLKYQKSFLFKTIFTTIEFINSHDKLLIYKLFQLCCLLRCCCFYCEITSKYFWLWGCIPRSIYPCLQNRMYVYCYLRVLFEAELCFENLWPLSREDKCWRVYFLTILTMYLM